MSLRAQVLTAFRWTASVRLLSQAITWAITLIVVRFLTPDDYGLLAMATVFVAFLTMFSELGLGPAIVQKRDVDVDLLRRVFGLVLTIHCLLTAILFLVAPLVAAFYHEPRVQPVVQVLSAQFLLSAFAVIPDAQLQRQMEFRKRSLLDFSGTFVAAVTTLALAWAGAGVWALVTGTLLNQTWRTVGLNRLSPFPHWPAFSLDGMRPLLSFGGHLTAAGVVGMVFLQADTVICAKLLGNEILGFYSVGVSLATLPSQKTAGLVNSVAFPAFSTMQHDVRQVRDKLLLGTVFLSFFAFPVSWGIASIAPEIVEVILGPKWTLAVVPLQALSLIVPFRMIGNLFITAVQGMGRADIMLRNTVWAVSVGIPILFVGAYVGGLNGISLAWLLVSPLLFVPFLMRSAPVTSLRVTEVLTAIMPAAGVALIMYAGVNAARHVIGEAHGGAVRMAILIAVGALIYGGASLVFNPKRTADVLSIVRSIVVAKRV